MQHDSKDNETQIEILSHTIQVLQSELEAQKKVTKNALRFSIGVGIACFFFVALNLSILFTIAGGVAGNERKVQSLQEQLQHISK